MAKCSADWSSVLSAASRAAWSAAGTAFSRAAEKRAECLADSSAVCLEALRAVRPVARSADLTAASMAENWAECSAGRTTAGRLRARLTFGSKGVYIEQGVSIEPCPGTFSTNPQKTTTEVKRS